MPQVPQNPAATPDAVRLHPLLALTIALGVVMMLSGFVFALSL